MLARVSIVVPIGMGETHWRSLLTDLKVAAESAEVILVAPTGEERPHDLDANAHGLACSVRRLVAPPGRANQMNAGASAAGREFLWFLHADSRLSPDSIAKLEASFADDARSLRYFDLAFLPDGPRGVAWNAWGARFRSRVLGMPFGDQGFCLPRATFHDLGGYDADAPYGEDHLLVWSARRRGVPLRALDAILFTSARRYRERGWLKTTRTHLYLTARQAIPEAWALLRSRTVKRRLVEPKEPTSDSRSS